MTLTIGYGPFGDQAAGTFNFTREGPAHVLYFEDSPRRVRAVLAGETVADSRRVKLLHETGLLPVYYFPLDDVRRDLLEPSDHTSHCPFKGDARYWSVRVGDRVVENALWNYPDPIETCPPIGGYAALYWNKMDAWFEEDEEVFVHPRDPYHRVDVLASSRHVIVRVNDEVLAETRSPRILFETGLPPRYYIPASDVRTELVSPSQKTTGCAYKGQATYWSAKAGDDVIDDLVWTYTDPTPAAADIAGYLCFFNEHVDLEVDGESLERPRTKWS